MGGGSDRPIDIAIERSGGDLLGFLPGAKRGPAIERAVANEAELAHRLARALVDHAADRLRKGRVAHAVEHNLGNRPAALDRLEAGLIIDRLGHAQQRPAPVERVRAGQIERPRGHDRRGAERHRRIDQLGLVADRAVVGQLAARRCRDQRRGGRRWDHHRRGRCQATDRCGSSFRRQSRQAGRSRRMSRGGALRSACGRSAIILAASFLPMS